MSGLRSSELARMSGGLNGVMLAECKDRGSVGQREQGLVGYSKDFSSYLK